MELVPLCVEDVLLKAVKRNLLTLFFCKRCERRRITVPDFLRPHCPSCAVIFFLRRMKERIIIEPICLFFTKSAIVRIRFSGLMKCLGCLFEHLFLKLFHPTEVDEGGIGDIGNGEILLCHPTVLCQRLHVDHHDVPGKGRDGLIWRIAASNGTQREHLPNFLSGFCKEVYKTIRLFSEISHPIFGRQRSRMQKDARLAFIATRFFTLTQEQAKERWNFDL